MRLNCYRFVTSGLVVLLFATTSHTQTTAFKYQGSLTDGGNPANGSFQMQFKLFDAASGGVQVGSMLNDVAVTATNGTFSVLLDFGASALSGQNRWLEIAVRQNSGQSYTTLSPREQIGSAPYAVRTLSAQQADLALNANQLGGVAASEYLTNTAASGAFIRNGTTQQTANFNVSGNGVIGGLVGLGTGTNGNFRLDSSGSIRAFSGSSAHFVAETIGGTNTWARYYMRSPNRSWFMGTSQNFNSDQFYLVDETAGQSRMTISTAGLFGLNNTNPQTGLDIRGTGVQVQQRITDNTSGNSLVLQGGAGSNMKVTGYNYNTSTAVPLYLSTDGANTVMNSGGGNVLQPGPGFGMPKAMIYVLGTGAISRCYNGITGATTGGCGFSVSVSDGHYTVNFGFDVTQRFYSLATYDVSSTMNVDDEQIVARIFRPANPNSLTVVNWLTWRQIPTFSTIVSSDFFLIVY